METATRVTQMAISLNAQSHSLNAGVFLKRRKKSHQRSQRITKFNPCKATLDKLSHRWYCLRAVRRGAIFRHGKCNHAPLTPIKDRGRLSQLNHGLHLFFIFCEVTSCAKIPYRSRNVPATFGRCDQALRSQTFLRCVCKDYLTL